MLITVRDAIASSLGYDRPREGLIGSGFSKMLAYQRATDVCVALGLPPDLDSDVLRRWGAGEVIHLGPSEARQ